MSKPQKRSSKLSRKIFSYRRTVFAVAFLLSALLVVAIYVGPLTQAQRAETDERSFAKKADKLLKQLRSAVTADRLAMAKGTFRQDESAVEQVSRIAPVLRGAGFNKVSVAVKVDGGDLSEIKAAGFPIQAQVGDLATLELDVDRLPQLASIGSIQKISAASLRHPLNDRARQSTGVDNGSGQRVVSQTGHGIVVGIIDSGIDFRHLDFTVPGSAGHQTRIKALLDMTEYGAQSPDPGWNYSLPGQSATIGHLYTEADLNSALQVAKPSDQNSDLVKQRDKSGHGTHVAATAAGNGLSSPTPGTYAGMAPEADLIIVKASRENDGNDDFLATDIINAMAFIKQKAAELNEPFVINLSLGGQVGAHDGTNPDERAIDDLVNSGSGRAVCVAAGNDGGSSIHARSTVPAGGAQTLDFNINGGAYFVDLYQANSDRFTVTVKRPDGTSLGPVAYDANGFSQPNGQASDQYLQIYNSNDDKGDADPANDQPDIFIIFKDGAPNGMWKITLQDADAVQNQPYDAWAAGEGVYFSTFMDGSRLITSPGNARAAITVGAFITRASNQTTIGTSADFSSPGPTGDGRQKPEISAPGAYLYSARSTDAPPDFGIIGTGGDAPSDSVHYTGLAGTSMATPVTTGAVALLLQQSPALSGSEVKGLLTTYAVLDIFTGSSWGPRFGFGKLNVANSINRSGGGLKKYTITGRLTDPDGRGVIDLQVFLSGASSAMARTDANGAFSFPGLTNGGNYTVAPSQQSTMTFTPSQFVFNNLNSDQTANFTRSATEVYSISGHVTDPFGNPISAAQVTVPGSFTVPGHLQIDPALTDSGGYYQWTALPKAQNYQVTPTFSNSMFAFTPTSTSVTSLGANQVINFVGTATRSTLSGRVTDGTNGLAGVLITATATNAPSSTATSDANGNYSLVNLTAALPYTVTASKANYEFTPFNQLLFVYQNTGSPQTFVGKVDNLIDHSDYFVTQHYRDFLNRDPDQSGLNFWTNQIISCGGNTTCLEVKRINVSGAFFLSIEFQQTGYLVERLYKTAFGDAVGNSTFPSAHTLPVPIIRLSEFLTDSQTIGQGVIVNSPGWEDKLESNKVAFIASFITRQRFTDIYGSLNNDQFVDRLNTNAGNPLSQTERNQLVADLNSSAKSRAQVLRAIAEHPNLVSSEFNRAFVLMQFFGYLRRNPDDPQDHDHTGYDFWLTKLNQFAGNFQNAEMVKAFISSDEYRHRFGL